MEKEIRKNKVKKTGLSSRPLIIQFNLFFFVFSVIPLGVLAYLFYQYVNTGKIDMDNTRLTILISLVGLGSLVGFFGVRNSLLRLASLSQKLKSSVFGSIDKSSILELAKEEGEIADLAKAFSEVMARLESNIKELKATKKTLYKVLSKVGKTISSIEDINILIQLTLETISEALLAKRAAVYVVEGDKLVLKALVGIDKSDVPLNVGFNEGTLGWVFREKRQLFVPLLDDVSSGDGKENLFSPPLICSPLYSHEKIEGAVILSGKKVGGNFAEDDLKILSNIANQIAISLENSRLSRDIEKAYFETISALALAVEARDPYSRGHSDRVADYSVKIADKLGLSPEEKKILRDACRLHDIGKIGVGDDILRKPGPLNEQEKLVMQKHPLVGESIVKPIRSLQNLLGPIRHHHEYLDGSGYPDGLKGDEIDILTRIITVADIFDALTTDRPYRKSLIRQEAFNILEDMANRGKVDQNLVNTAKEVL